jgi:transcription-repair coupling factor (superfamily II helicase)
VNVDAIIRNTPAYKALDQLIAPNQGPVSAEGLWGSCAPLLAGLLAEQQRRPLLYITAHVDDADAARDDIETILGQQPELLPQLDIVGSETPTDSEDAGERLRICLDLLRLDPQTGWDESAADAAIAAGVERLSPHVIVAPLLALMQPVATPEAIQEQSQHLSIGDQLDPDQFADWLTTSGFKSCDQVEVPGDFARRGGIIDVYSNAHTDPVRIEFFGDEIDSLRSFDAGTQRSSTRIPNAIIPALNVAATSASGAGQRSTATTSFLSLLPRNTLIALNDPAEIQELGRTYWQRLGEKAGIVPVERLLQRMDAFQELHLNRFAHGSKRAVDFGATNLPQFDAKTPEAIRGLVELSERGHVVVFCENPAESQRFNEILLEQLETPPVLQIEIGRLTRGFALGDTAFVAHHEIFGRTRQRRTLRRVPTGRPIDTFLDLSAGDHVVHVLHGVGRFQGLKTIERAGRRDEYLAVEFAEQAMLHVPVSQIHVVQKYIGGFRGRPKLSKLGGTAWKRTKDRVADAVTDMAAELLAIQAQRNADLGVAYPSDTLWQHEFEGEFPFDETEDQLRSLAEIKTDLNRPRPMDRLLCGDVGYGKTELAIRAAFKVCEYGKQVAVLVPTTVLAEQHYNTFRQRMADYPFRVEVLSRFRTKKEQSEIVAAAKRGQVDILIGTHRLLSKDVNFSDLGLVVIDEEQRFGVEAKEKLKHLRATVEVLTLSATPIPRTLHMSMLGIRDISSLQTPPVDRRSIVTQVRMWEDKLVRDAIVRELNRDGQIYIVHNFVRDLDKLANRIRTLVPDARVLVGHGQMSGQDLEAVMLAFIKHEADILVSTNIIEAGLDIPAANTIIINRPERFGLADLHQLRGRVGRGKQRAYAYLLLSPKHPVTDISARRLKAIEHYSDLGAGFQIAMRDLEIRGAGNILGAEQSGHIEAVGYEMYCQLLESAVRKLQNQPQRRLTPVNLELGINASIPRAYVRSERQRMDVYKRLSMCLTPADLAALTDDLRDAFGPIPDDVQQLLDLAELRVLAAGWDIRSIVLEPPDVIFSVTDLQKVNVLFSDGPGSPRMPDPHTIHWRLPERFLQISTLLAVLRKQLSIEPATAAAETLSH